MALKTKTVKFILFERKRFKIKKKKTCTNTIFVVIFNTVSIKLKLKCLLQYNRKYFLNHKGYSIISFD